MPCSSHRAIRGLLCLFARSLHRSLSHFFRFRTPFAFGADIFQFVVGQMLDADKGISAVLTRISSSSLTRIAAPSRFWEFWIRKTIRNVTIVVPVLMTSCQVSEY